MTGPHVALLVLTAPAGRPRTVGRELPTSFGDAHVTFWNRPARQVAFDAPAVVSFRNKIADGTSLAPQAWALLRANRQLALLPSASAAATVAAAAALLIPALLAAALNAPVVSYALVVLFAVLAAFISATCAAALVLATMAYLGDEPLAAGTALARAWGFRARIAPWALVGGQAAGRGALAARVLFGGAWATASIFVLPVMLVEGLGMRAAGARSVALVRTGFAAGATSGLGVAALFLPQALATGVLVLALVALAFVVGSWLAALLLLLAAASALAAAGAVLAATTTVARAMLYHQLTSSPYDQPAGP